ncbi:alpha/beta hydrolase [Plantactinospora sp. S1510]|uniref:Alpha/beta hydrolase n=1 Tax=Plantactinospora alkalitolerans TaxID=2789879 RepID=A0ABS0GQU4_9ACTN|nr:alpha/beta fold hydrolase [Plantactinospora alkalitolerans]MBF9128571.1 alpha/beta hydrolase [Plantactinospora alkalitolerans]
MVDPEFQVSGGAGGTGARYEDIGLLARHSDDLAGELGAISVQGHDMLADPDLVASALLNPDGFARIEAGLLRALDGPEGLTALSLGFEQRAIALRTVVASYRAVDEERARTMETLRWALGYGLGTGIKAAAAGPLMLLPFVPPLTAAGLLFGDDIDLEQLVTDHPGIIDTLVGMGPGLISSLPGAPMVGDVPGAADLLGEFYDDGTYSVTAPEMNVFGTNTDDSDVSMTKPPQGFGDLIDGLDYRNEAVNAGEPDQIDVRVITHPDGSRAYVVDLPGTKEMNMPWSADSPFLNDMGTNVHVLGGDTTSRQHAIAEALRMAGATADDPVMLVGHSQGGMVAAQAAQDTATGAFPYNVTHVVTAGSPIGNTDVPAGVQVLALENARDIVPHLDATDNPDRSNVTTVTFDDQNGTIGDNHGTRSAYLPAAQALDRSTDPSVQAYRDSAGAFLNGDAVESKVYELNRVH